jgi:hypothetical protein
MRAGGIRRAAEMNPARWLLGQPANESGACRTTVIYLHMWRIGGVWSAWSKLTAGASFAILAELRQFLGLSRT